MRFFVGMHNPSDAWRVPAAFISVTRLACRRSPFRVRRWIMDSGAFSTVTTHGGYPEPVEAYAAEIRRWARNGAMLAAVAQDFMCEPFVLERTGLLVQDHQQMTVDRYDELVACDTDSVRIMPVLQGYGPDDYVNHLGMYGARLMQRMWVGVGSLCKRNANPAKIEAVLLAIHRARPDLRLHGFGVKVTALGRDLIRKLLFSADSMAWSFAARYEGRDANNADEAVSYVRRVRTMPRQLALGVW